MNQENTAVSQEEQAVSGQPSAVSGVAGKYQPYPEYKDSGVEWLGDIPSHWVVRRLKHTSTLQSGVAKGKNLDEKETINVPMLRVANVQDGYFDLSDIHQIEIESGSFERYCLKKGDVLMNEGGDNDKLGRGAVWRGEVEPCIHQNHVFAIRPVDIESDWLQRVTQSAYAKFHFYCEARQSTNLASISSSNIKETPLLIPPQPEREAILAFLDHETARIDALIAKQQRLIALLKEKRQAVISHAVTKGLPSINGRDAPMKDSGVEWLGQVPAHWETSRIGWLCSVGNGMTPNRSNPDYWMGGDQPWLNSSKVNDREVVQADQFVTMKAVAECSLPKVSADSIIMAITGEGKTRGTSAIVRIDTTINQHIAYMTPSNSRLSPEFLLAWLESQYERIRFESEGWGSTKAAITCSDIKRYPLPLPPYAEQSKICDYLVAQHRKFNNLTEKAKAATQLLQERRTALISAAVTGKIDLRGWQPPANEAG